MPAYLATALFDGATAARAAASQLVGMGVDHGAVRLVPQEGEAGGVWGALASLGLPDADRYGYAEGIRRGGVLLVVPADAFPGAELVRALEEAGAVDLDEREGEWWSGGWRGYRPDIKEPASGAAETPRTVSRERLPGGGRVRRYQARTTG